MARAAVAVSDYERQRQEKIAQNQALFKQLQLNAASAGLTAKAAKSKPTTANTKAKRAAPKVKQEDPGPRRTSSRLRGIVADSEVAKRKAEEEHDAFREAERAKRQRVSSDMKLGDIVVAGQNWTSSGNWLRDVGPARPYERTFDVEEVQTAPSSKEIKELREKMSGLELWEGFEPSRIKITPERVYALAFHPTPEKPLVLAGDKMGNLGLFDASQKVPIKNEDDDEEDDDGDQPAVTTFKPHTRTITSIQSTPSQPNVLYTSSYDSSIRKLDLAKGVSVEVYGPSDTDGDEPLSGVQIPEAEPHMLYFASLHGTFGMHDTRTDPATKSNTVFLALSEKKIGGFSIHPSQPHLLATASLDRMLRLWDLRKITGKSSSRLPALIGEHESRLSVSTAVFNRFGQVATSSYDDTVKIYDFASKMGSIADWPAGKSLGEDEMSPTTVIPHNNQTGRWVTILKPQWQAHPSAVGGSMSRFVIGNMNRFVDVYAGSGEQLAQLGGDDITAVPAVASFHDSCDWIAAGTASGKLCLWM